PRRSSDLISSDGIDAGGEQITNVASGGTPSSSNKNAANMADVDSAMHGLTSKGFALSDGTTQVSQDLGKSIAIKGADGVTTTADAGDHSITVGLDQDTQDSLAAADNSVQYDGSSRDSVTLGGTTSTDGGKTGGTTVTNLAQGDVSANSTDAVNGSQLYATNQNVSDNADNIA